MQRIRIFLSFTLVILLGTLAACTQSGSSPSKPNCSYGGEICLSIKSPDQSFSTSSPFQLEITVSSTKDISDIFLLIENMIDITIDDPNPRESNVTNSSMGRGLSEWNFSIKAGQTNKFIRTFHILPSAEGEYQILVSVFTKDQSIVAREEMYAAVSKSVSEVVREGTPDPTIIVMHNPVTVYGPGTRAPTDLPQVITITPRMANPGVTQAVPTSTPVASPNPLSPYPPPPTPQPTSSAYP